MSVSIYSCDTVIEGKLVLFMQTPPPSQPSSKGKIGYIVALTGSALTIISFLALPFITVLGILSFSLLQLANLADALKSYGSSMDTTSSSSQLSGGIAFVWISLVVAIAACIVSLVFTIRKSSRAIGGAVSLIVLGLIGAGIFLFMIISITNELNSLGSAGSTYPTTSTSTVSIGIGAWLCVIGMVATAVGGIVAIVARPPALATAPYGYGGAPQSLQYPPNPYTQYPQQQPPDLGYPPQQSPNPRYPPQQPSNPGYPPQQPSNPGYPPQQPPQW
jgi:hypothetical protein